MNKITMTAVLIILTSGLLVVTGCRRARAYFTLPPPVENYCDPPPEHPYKIVGSTPCRKEPGDR